MMKNKRKQIGQGIMLATVLGLGWGVAGDISHAAGNEGSQKQEAPKWTEQTLYKSGDIVSYEGTAYEMIYFSSKGDRPDVTSSKWKVRGMLARWDSIGFYFKGDSVTYKGKKYEMIDDYFSMGDEPDKSSSKWKEVNGNQLEGNLKKENGNNAIEKVWNFYTLYRTGDI
ncbi:hypothetical protein CN553_31785, partial [Bacillus cereus]